MATERTIPPPKTQPKSVAARQNRRGATVYANPLQPPRVPCPPPPPPQQLGSFGSVALAWLLDREAAAEPAPTIAPRAKAVIQLFMVGGASQCDTFDYKPELIRRHGQQVNFRVTGGTIATPGPALKSPWDWRQPGQTGRWVTERLPHLAELRRRDGVSLRHAFADQRTLPSGQTMQVSRLPDAGLSDRRAPGSATAWAA